MEFKEIKKSIKNVEPFSKVPVNDLNNLIKNSFYKKIEIGEQIIEFNKIPEFLPILINGSLRILVLDEYQNPITLQKVEESQIIGWSTVLRGKSDISVIASSESEIIFVPTMKFISLINLDCMQKYISKTTIDEIYTISNIKNSREGVIKNINKKRFLNWYSQLNLNVFQVENNQVINSGNWLVSSTNFINFSIGEIINSETKCELRGKLPGRLIPLFDLPKDLFNTNNNKNFNKGENPKPSNNSYGFLLEKEIEEREALQDLYGNKNPNNIFPHIKGNDEIDEKFVILKMLARYFELPFRKDTILKILEHKKNSGNFENFGLIEFSALLDMQGLSTANLTIGIENLQRVPTPSLLQIEKKIYIIWNINKDGIILSDPKNSQIKITFNDFKSLVREHPLNLLSLQRTKNSPKKRFDLSWFLPYIRKHRKILIQVFLASFFVQLFQLFNPLLIQQIIDAVVSQGNVNSLNVYGTLLITFAIGEASLSFLRTYLFNDTTNRIDISLGSQIINHLFKLPLSYFSNRPTGEISNRINELSKIRNFLTSRALTLILDTLFCFIYISVMLMYSVKLTIWAFVVLPVFITITILISPLVKEQLRTQAIASSKVQSHLVETLGNMETIKGQKMELFSRWRWQNLYGNQINTGFKNVITNGIATSLSTFFQQLSSLFVLLAGIKLVLDGQLTLGQLIAFRIIAGYVTQPLLRLTTLWQSFQEIFISLERISDVVNTPQEIEIFGEGLPPIKEIQGNIIFKNASFRFHEKLPYVLKNINLEIPASNFVGVVGLSGSGKSTLFKLVTKTYDINEGSIYIDGYDITKVDLYSLRNQIGYVPQDSVLFEGSIKENISISSPNSSFKEIENAAEIACASEFIQQLPSGYNYQVGEKGQNLSGGQRQRIAIARTILRKPNLLILDESTSALDSDTEKLLLRNLKLYTKNISFIFITHRLNAIQDADQIIVVDKGSISESGTHKKLIDQAGRYFTLYSQQNAINQL